MQIGVPLLLEERKENDEDDSDDENVVDMDGDETLADEVVAVIEMFCVLDDSERPVVDETVVLDVSGEEVEDALWLVALIPELTIEILIEFEDETCCDDKVRDVEDVVEGLELCFMLDVTLLSPEGEFLDEL